MCYPLPHSRSWIFAGVHSYQRFWHYDNILVKCIPTSNKNLQRNSSGIWTEGKGVPLHYWCSPLNKVLRNPGLQREGRPVIVLQFHPERATSHTEDVNKPAWPLATTTGELWGPLATSVCSSNIRTARSNLQHFHLFISSCKGYMAHRIML